MQFNQLKIKKISVETTDTISLHFAIPADLQSDYQYKPGQYITIEAEIDGEIVRRSYSMSSAPHEDTLAVTIKRLPGGRMSTFAHSNWKSEDLVNVSTPEGKFLLNVDDERKRDHYFIAAGSGITPVISMIKSVLEGEPMSTCHLLYGSRTENSIIFKEEIEKLVAKYEGQLNVRYTLSKVKKGGLLGMFKSKNAWNGHTGRIDGKMIKNFLGDFPASSSEKHFYLCGPGNLIETAENALKTFGENEKNIHKEHFIIKDDATRHEIASGTAEVTVELNGDEFTFTTDGEKFLLDEMLELKKNPPFSCTSGACSSCMAKVTEGHAEMEVCYALDDDEVADGFILTCQAKATTPTIKLTFE